MSKVLINDAGFNLIKQFEGLKLDAYPDPATGGDPWTIGYGHTGKEVVPGLIITPKQAEELLCKDLVSCRESIDKLVTVPINPNQCAALISFVFNLGPQNLKISTLLKLLNQSKFKEAAEEFPKWNKANKKVMAGLTRRRQAEKELFLS